MSDPQGRNYQPGDVVNGFRWTGSAWERVWQPGDIQNGHRFDGYGWIPLPEKKWWQKSWVIILGAVGVIVVAAGVAALFDRGGTVAGGGSQSSSSEDLLWLPRGFQYYEADRSLGFSFSVPEADAADCDYGDKCATLAVVSRDACRGGIFVAISVLDDDGTVVDRSNEITGGVRGGEIAAVAIPLFGDDGTQFRVSEMSCL